MSWFTLVKKAASLIPTPTTGKGRLFLDDAGAVAVKNDAGALLTLQAIPQGFIEGLRMEWVSGTQIRVSTGAAYVPGAGRVVELAAPVTLTPTLAASTWYHLYLVGGTVTAEADTTAPAAPYYGTARTKTGDTSRRYIGSFFSKADSTIVNFVVAGGMVNYQEATDVAPFRALSAGTATSQTNVNLGPAGVPVTASLAKVNVTNLSTDQALRLSNPNASTSNMQGVRPLSGFPMTFPVDQSQRMTYVYAVAPAGPGGYIDVIGYALER